MPGCKPGHLACWHSSQASQSCDAYLHDVLLAHALATQQFQHFWHSAAAGGSSSHGREHALHARARGAELSGLASTCRQHLPAARITAAAALQPNALPFRSRPAKPAAPRHAAAHPVLLNMSDTAARRASTMADALRCLLSYSWTASSSAASTLVAERSATTRSPLVAASVSARHRSTSDLQRGDGVKLRAGKVL